MPTKGHQEIPAMVDKAGSAQFCFESSLPAFAGLLLPSLGRCAASLLGGFHRVTGGGSPALAPTDAESPAHAVLLGAGCLAVSTPKSDGPANVS